MSLELEREIFEFVGSIYQMTIASCHRNQPWVATVFFASDDDLNFYFMSHPESRHSKEFSKNHRIAATINREYEQPEPLQGLQIEGTIIELKNEEAISAIDLYVKRFPDISKYLFSSNHVSEGSISTKIYKMSPRQIWFLNEGICGGGGRKCLDKNKKMLKYSFFRRVLNFKKFNKSKREINE